MFNFVFRSSRSIPIVLSSPKYLGGDAVAISELLEEHPDPLVVNTRFLSGIVNLYSVLQGSM